MNKPWNILIACEESQAVCKAMRERGHNAFSCDILPCSGGHPEWHIQGDVLELLYGHNVVFYTENHSQMPLPKWDLIIAHPPCTYISNAGAKHLFRGKTLNNDRYNKGLDAKKFFLKLLNYPFAKICVENPVSSKVFEMPKHSQEIQPYEYGHPYTKKTRLWIKGLPLLKPTEIVRVESNTRLAGNWFNKAGKERQKNRSKTFEGIAKAMAEQWTPDLSQEKGQSDEQ